ncbi:hypothetical protein [Sporomusa sp. KB1]|jgi:hypothetical protein|uniref:hypothetical protein n=1 Tax=Sporomusa sp. KB1 TaxID=943346 RepID=UPI0011A32F46|nr:hypothetical protein [Sporomusa sp. KB1]TWH48509.1 hypothetical protein Salpa_4672 [Sporomusa sp. KB1]
MFGRTELYLSEAKKLEWSFRRLGGKIVISITADSYTEELILDQDDFDKFIESGQPLVTQKLEGVA